MKTEEALRSVPITSVPDAVLVVTKDRRVVAANSLAERLLGREDGELVGVRVDELVPHRDRDLLQELVGQLVSSSSPARSVGQGRESLVLTPDGREVPVEIAAGPLGDDEHLVAVIRDISESVAVKTELERSEYRFRVAADIATDVIYDADVANDLQGWMGDIDHLTGYRPGEFPRTITGAVVTVHPDDLAALQSRIDHAIETGSSFDAEYRVRRQDGSYMYVK